MRPSTWAEVLSGIALLLGGNEEDEAAVLEWVREAVHARYGADSLHAISRAHRQLAFQKTLGSLYDLQALEGDLAFCPNIRTVLQGVFARRWDGLHLEGPPWRLSSVERDMPTFREWLAEADFGSYRAKEEGARIGGR